MNLVWALSLHFLMLSLIAIGGASATLPEMHRVLVDNNHLMTDAQFSHLFAISQAAPGPNVLFVALFGWQVAGLAGAFFSLLSMCGPSSLLSVAVEHFGSKHQNARWYVILRQALTPLSIGLLLSTSLVLMKTNSHLPALALTTVTVLALLRFRLNPIWLVLVGAVVGAFNLV